MTMSSVSNGVSKTVAMLVKLKSQILRCPESLTNFSAIGGECERTIIPIPLLPSDATISTQQPYKLLKPMAIQQGLPTILIVLPPLPTV